MSPENRFTLFGIIESGSAFHGIAELL